MPISLSAKAMLKNQNGSLIPHPSEASGWTHILARYRKPSPARSIVELIITAGPLVLLWVLMWATLNLGYWVALMFAVPAAGFLVRLFIIQHDCGHGAFFHRRLANDWVGRVIGVLTLTPYDFWRRTHAVHHSTSGNLDRRGMGDIDTLTVREYLALSRWRRLCYRVYRHPIIMFGLGPAFLFIVQHRVPIGLMRAGWQPWLSAMATNVAIAVLAAVMIWLVGVFRSCWYIYRSCCWRRQSESGCSTSSTNLRIPHGLVTALGTCMRWRFTVAHIMICRASCAGSPLILVFITSIICAVGYLTTDCLSCCTTTPTSA